MSKKYRLLLLAPAQKELEEIAALHMSLVGPKSARKITDRIYHSLQLLSNFPLMGASLPDRQLRDQGYRVLVCGEYLSFYRVFEDTVAIYHIVHGKTDYPKLFHSFEKEESSK